MLREQVDSLDILAESRILSSLERNSRRDAIVKLRELEQMSKLYLQQKAKIKWICDGDENSRFFHGMLKNKHRKERIHGITISGEWCTDPELIKKETFEFFRNKFHEPWPVRPKLISSLFKRLKPDQSSFIEAEITLYEIKIAVWCCGSDKAPGPDGLTFKLFKSKWESMKVDISRYVKHFESFGNFSPGCNSSFITLVPKVKDPTTLSDYRPISLIGCIYKIVAKILANRLKGVGSVVDEVQSVYIKDRNILDGPFIINEIFTWAKKT